MKANELQIGDYIMFNKNIYIIEEISKKGWVHLIHNDGSECRVELSSDYILDTITPIPLTAEILKKNGFLEFIPHNWQIVIDNVMIELREPEHNMAIWLDWEEHDTGTYASYMLPGPNCVHELQHALRLCNIEKEIEL